MTKEEIMQAIESMTVLELSELVKAMEEKFGVSAAAPVAVAAAAPAAAGGAAGQTVSRHDHALLLPDRLDRLRAQLQLPFRLCLLLAQP